MSEHRTPSPTRRQALTAVAVTGLGAPLLAACSSDGSTGSDADQGAAAPAPAPEQATPLVAAADVPVGGGVVVEEARTVVTQPTEGDFRAFSAVCPHQGCLVSEVSDTINCRCHNSSFSIEDGTVQGGPSPSPLSGVDVVVEGDQVVTA